MQKTYLSGLTVLRMIGWRRRIIALLRILCGGLCAVDAGYRWATIKPLVVGWFAPWISVAYTHLFAAFGAAVETIIACCLLCGVLTNLACGLGIVLTLLGYTTRGALPGPDSFDLGILFVFTLTFFGLALGSAGEAYGMDGWLSGRLGRWSFLSSSRFEGRVQWVNHDNHKGPATSTTLPLSPRGGHSRWRRTTQPLLLPGHDNHKGPATSAPLPLSLRGGHSRWRRTTQPLLTNSESRTVDVADAPRRRQRILFM